MSACVSVVNNDADTQFSDSIKINLFYFYNYCSNFFFLENNLQGVSIVKDYATHVFRECLHKNEKISPQNRVENLLTLSY